MSDPASEPATGAPTRRAGRQVGLRGLLLLVIAAALGLSIAADRRRIATLTTRIDAIRPLARELDVADPARFAAIALDSPWSEEERWDVHLPEGHR